MKNKKKIVCDFTNGEVKIVSDYLQNYMRENNIVCMTADECADLLAKDNLLSNEIGPKPGFNFRQMLRDGRDGLINKIEGVYQERPKTKWIISCKKSNF
jgi:hypothetical protein